VQQGAPPASVAAASAVEPTQQQQQQRGSSDEASTSYQRGPDKQQVYLEQKYGGKESHVNLTKEQVEGMLDRVLADSSPVRYLLESLKMVCVLAGLGGGGGGGGGGGSDGVVVAAAVMVWWW